MCYSRVMRIRNRTASILFKAVLVVLGAAALLQQSGILTGSPSPVFLNFFTNLSNLVVVVYFAIDAIWLVAKRKDDAAITWAPKFKYACMMAITVTFLVAMFMLNGGMIFVDGHFNWHFAVLHGIVPVMAIADWLLFDVKGTMGKFDPLVWTALPIIYAIYVFVRVALLGGSMTGFGESRYPYPFIDVDANGWPMVLITMAAMIAFFIALGYVYRAIDRRLAKSK